MKPKVFKGEASAERRKYPRIPLTIAVQFMMVDREKLSAALESVSDDLGVEGLAMISATKLPKDQKLLITLLVPEDANEKLMHHDASICTEKGCIPVAVFSRVAWCKDAEDKKFRIGVQFLEITETGRQILKDFFLDYKLDYSNSNLMH